MADGKIEIDLELKDSKASSQAKKAGNDIAKGVEKGLKDVSKAADKAGDSIKKPFESAASSAKSSMEGVGDAAKSSFSDVADAANNAAGDAASAFEDVPADASGAFADVSSEAEAGFSGVAEAADNVSGDAADSFEQIGEAAQGAGEEVQEALSFKTLVGAGIATEAITELAGKLVDLANQAIEVGMAFDAGMSQVAATMGVTVDQVGELRAFAKQMGETTAFSASQAAEALNYMALAGYDAETSMRVLPTVLNLAAAGGMELAAASDMVTDAQSALGLSVEEAEVMVDQMAKTSSKTNTSVEQLGNAFLTVGGTAKNLSGGTKELSQMLGILADNGIKGSEGGTALRNVILSLSAPTDKAAKSIEALGLQVFDAEGNMRAMPDIFNDLNAAMEPLTQEERTQTLNNIFNKVDLKSVNALMGTSADRFNEVASAIDNAQGSAAKMAETQLDNLAGDVTLLESATEGFFIAVSDQLSPALRELTQFASNTVMPTLTGIASNFDKVAPAVMAGVAAYAIMKVASRQLNNENSKLRKIIKVNSAEWATYSTRTKLATAATRLGAAAAGMSAKEFTALSKSQKAAAIATNALKTSFNALKSVGVVLAISAAVEAFTAIASAIESAQKKAQRYEAATKGLEQAAAGLTVKIDDETGAFDDLAGAVASVNLEDVTQAHIDLANSISDTMSGVASGQAMLGDYAAVIEELAGRSDLTETELAKLNVAIDGVNQAAGTNYEVVGGNGEAYRIMADGAEVAKDAIYEVIEAQKAQLRYQATVEAYAAAYTQLMNDQQALADQMTVVDAAAQKLEEAEANLAEYGTQAAAQAAEDARRAYDNEVAKLGELEAQAGATQSSMNKLEEQELLASMAAEKSASALVRAADSNTAFIAGVQGAGVNLLDFTAALEDMGFTADQVSSLTAEDAMKMAQGWKKGTGDLIAAVEGAKLDVPEKLRQMGAGAYQASNETGKQAGKGLADGLSAEAQSAINAALETVELTDEELAKLQELAAKEGEASAIAYANKIAAGKTKAKQAGKTDASAARDGMGSVDMKGVGEKIGQAFATGVGSKKEAARQAGASDATSARDGLKSQDAYAMGWGQHLGENFAAGLRSSGTAVGNAALAVANAAKDVLGHSIPKDGPLREGGKGEKLWGEHLVENIAAGMTSSAAQQSITSATRQVAVDIKDSLLREMEAVNPMEQLEQSLTKGSAAFSMSAMVSGTAPSYTTNSQTVNFNGAVNDPDIIARQMRMQARYGLAGHYS